MLLKKVPPIIGSAPPNRWVALMAGTINMGARHEVLSAVAERHWSAGRVEKGVHP
jgi:hypothetical protein